MNHEHARLLAHWKQHCDITRKPCHHTRKIDGRRLHIEIMCDENQTMHVTYLDLATGRELYILINQNGRVQTRTQRRDRAGRVHDAGPFLDRYPLMEAAFDEWMGFVQHELMTA